MEGTPPQPPPSSPVGYEFDSAENQVIRKTGSRTWAWGLIIFSIGLLQGLLGVLFAVGMASEGELAAGLVVFVIYGVLVLIPILVGLYFMRAGKSMKAVVTTVGSDIEHLMGAMRSLGKAFLIQIVATILFVLLWVALVAISVPRFGETRDRAYLAAMRSDLRNLQTAQEIYYGDENYTYAGDLRTLQFIESEGVTIGVVSYDTAGFGATATHVALPEARCSVYVGADHAVGPATEPGVVTCDEG